MYRIEQQLLNLKKELYGDLNADQIMYRLGYQRVATPEGDTFALRVK
jgi:hypothetical protein